MNLPKKFIFNVGNGIPTDRWEATWDDIAGVYEVTYLGPGSTGVVFEYTRVVLETKICFGGWNMESILSDTVTTEPSLMAKIKYMVEEPSVSVEIYEGGYKVYFGNEAASARSDEDLVKLLDAVEVFMKARRNAE